MSANEPESFYAMRRTDGEEIGDYSWVSAGGPDDWTPAEDDAEEADEPIEYELCRMTVEVVSRRTFGPSSPPCDGWEGADQYPAASWVAVILRTDGTDQTYPARDIPLKQCDTQEEADALIAALPETFHIFPTYGRLTEISRDRLTTEEQGYPSRPGRCVNCGWPKRAHDTPAPSPSAGSPTGREEEE